MTGATIEATSRSCARVSARRYAQLVAANAIRKLLTASWNQLQPSQRVEFRNYLLSHLVSKGPASEHFVVACLVQLVATLTKLSWMDSDEYQKIVPDICEFLHASADHLLLGLSLLTQVRHAPPVHVASVHVPPVHVSPVHVPPVHVPPVHVSPVHVSLGLSLLSS